MSNEKYCNIAFPVETFSLYSYLVPSDMAVVLQPGMRVLAPFGRRVQLGYCLEVSDEIPQNAKGHRLKRIRKIVDDEVIFSGVMLELIQWISRYYLSGPGLVCKIAHPSEKGLVRLPVYALDPDQKKDARLADLSLSIDGMPVDSSEFKNDNDQDIIKSLLRDKVLRIENSWPRKMRSSKSRFFKLKQMEMPTEKLTLPQMQVIKYLQSLEERQAAASEIRKTLNISESPLKTLRAKDLLEEMYIEDDADPFNDGMAERLRDVRLNDEQSRIIEAIDKKREIFFPVLIHGVTGSGKTEIYIQLAKRMLDRGKDVIILVPEISLTPQIAGRFRSVFKEKVSIWHSQMSPAQRLWTWKRMQDGLSKVVVGARSALFAPFRNIGLIIIDEEHESSYKQESPAPRYHARDTALYYGRLLNIPVIMGSATPSLESWYLAEEKKISKFHLAERFGPAIEPRIEIADMSSTHHDGTFSKVLMDEIRDKLAKGEQVILLQNRRGFNTVQHCRSCGKTIQCKACSVNFTYHKNLHLLRCHYCGASQSPLQRCPDCGESLSLRGTGTQKVEEHLNRYLPDAKVVRMDYDTTRNKNSHIRILNAFENKEYDILLGTQMIAKGLDFANVTLVGIINADIGLSFPDFRSSEQLFQLIHQVSGRAGRGELKGNVIIQTYNPEAASVKLAAQGKLRAFIRQETDLRKELNYPPFSRLALIRVIGSDEKEVKHHCSRIKDLLSRNSRGVTILGPAAAPIEKVQGMVRWQMILKSGRLNDPNAVSLRQLATEALNMKKANSVRVQFNMDPYSMF